jgi:hypothetical protein
MRRRFLPEGRRTLGRRTGDSYLPPFSAEALFHEPAL